MVSHQHRCIFIHIPKCAGTSIESVLGHLDGYAGREAQDHRSLRMLEEPFPFSRAVNGRDNLRHAFARLHHRRLAPPSANPANDLRVTAGQFAAYLKFTVVRNPWARAHSWWANVMQDRQHWPSYGLTEPVSLGRFLDRQAGRGMLRPQLDWIRGFDGRIGVDFIGRFETLDRDFAEIAHRLAIATPLPHLMRMDKPDYRDAYDNRTRGLVARVYAEEIALFGYGFAN
ncbi:MAG: sulfotransferase family 2 domain-containing protein [Vicinamibacterales bacterium]